MLASKLPIVKTEVDKCVWRLVGGTQTSRLLRLRVVGAEVWDGVLLDVLIKTVLVPVDSVSFGWPWVVDRWRSMCHVGLSHGGHS